MTRVLAAAAALLILAGCEQQYRYPCHNPANWETEQCQKPICEINKDCPEHILKGVNGNGNNGINTSNINFNTSSNNSCQQCNSPATNNSFVRSNQQGAK